jgi:hypothetical protein
MKKYTLRTTSERLEDVPFPRTKKTKNNRLVGPDAKVKVFAALADSHYKFRTIRGISKATGLSEDAIVTVISQESKKVVVSSRKSTTGESLFTSRDRYEKSASFGDKIFGVIFNRVY